MILVMECDDRIWGGWVKSNRQQKPAHSRVVAYLKREDAPVVVQSALHLLEKGEKVEA